MSNTEHEYKYAIDLPQFYAWAQPFITRGQIQTRVIKQWYIPEELRKGGVVRIRQVIKGSKEIESTVLTIKVPTDEPAIRNEFNFVASHDFSLAEFIDALDISANIIVKDRWDITKALGLPLPAIGELRSEAVVDFFVEDDGTTTAVLEVENQPKNWVWPSFVTCDVTANKNFTNFARASKLSPK